LYMRRLFVEVVLQLAGSVKLVGERAGGGTSSWIVCRLPGWSFDTRRLRELRAAVETCW
jgi:hypothetical protein